MNGIDERIGRKMGCSGIEHPSLSNAGGQGQVFPALL